MRIGLRDFVPPIALRGQRWLRRRVQSTAPGEQSASYYDKIYGEQHEYGRHYTQSIYYPSWTVIVDRMKRLGVKRILDIGCGPGQFASYLFAEGFRDYHGIDFSSRAIEMARKNAPALRFLAADALTSELVSSTGNDVVVSLEFLEHIERDLDVLRRIAAGTRVIASVPNFPSHGHVRHFTTADAVRARYGAVLDDMRVDAILLHEKGTSLYLLEGRARAGA